MVSVKRTLKAFLLGTAMLGVALSAHAALLFDNTNNSALFDETRGPDSGILAQIVVGNAPVVINQFGVFGQLTTTANSNWAIFDDTTGSPLFATGTIATGPTRTLAWYDSPVFADFTLAANQTYYIGIISDQAFTYHWYCCSAPTITQNGLTSPGGNGAGSNGNFSNAANPVLDDRCCFVQQNTRIFGPDSTTVPESSTLFLLGLAGLGLVRTSRVARRVTSSACA